ncbi:glycosyltransferase [Edaphobacter bradus]|uniref:glycosyltransferase n=1 Tax=Edaphobacter bradus TaxID=2259016 RepID=UPI0021E07AB2|nr:glycosyltransferase [Edaphobacter bradus]
MIEQVHGGQLSVLRQERFPHVLLVVDTLGKTLGGGERIALKLASLLPHYGYRASILTFSLHPETAALDSPPCPIYLLPLNRTYDLRAMRAALHLRRFLKQQQVRIVQTFFESSDIWAGFVTKALSDAKLIWSRRDMGILRTSKHEAAYRMMAGFPDAVFAVSNLVRQHIIDVDHVDPARVLTIYNGLDISAWQVSSSSRDRSRAVVTTAGNIRRVKGHDIFIKAAASVIQQFPQAQFSIAGDVLEPDYFAELQALVASLNLTMNFHFTGGVSNLPGHLTAADIFVLPSRSEGFSNAIIEAMAAALPVVATDVGGNAEAVQDGVTGFIVPPEDPEALAAAITRLLADPAKAAQMGTAGKARAAEEFTQQVMMTRTTQTYAKLLAGS